MRVRSIGHACLDIQTRGPRVLTDPWWTGPAYTRQWYPWPRPAHAGVADTAYDYVYLSHGHEDHLHLDTLRTLRPGATAIVPRFAGTGGLGWLRGEGLFADVRELAHGESLDLGGGVTATMYINVTDSMLVLDDGRHVFVDANDALHAAPRATRDYFTALLRARQAASTACTWASAARAGSRTASTGRARTIARRRCGARARSSTTSCRSSRRSSRRSRVRSRRRSCSSSRTSAGSWTRATRSRARTSASAAWAARGIRAGTCCCPAT
jgi:hypothetical protein